MARRALAACGLAWLCTLCACSDGAVATSAVPGGPSPVVAGQPAQGKSVASQDRLPVREPAVAAAVPVPLATTPRERVVIREIVTSNGEPLEAGSIEVPKGWLISGTGDRPCAACEGRLSCVLWEAVSPDGSSRMMLLSPRRGFEDAVDGEGSVPSGIALAWLPPVGDEAHVDEANIQTGRVPAAMPATRMGWMAGGAWWSMVYESFGAQMREFRAMDVETKSMGRRLHRVQGWPMLLLRMPADHYDAAAVEAVRRSLRFDPGWVAQWWLAWEMRTIRERCARGYHRGMCHVEEGYADYFQSGDTLGLWDVRSDSPYELPMEQHYDAAAVSHR